MSEASRERLALLLGQIEQTLVETVSASVQRLAIGEPAYCLFLWYYDTTVFGGYTPDLGVGLEALRQACRAEYGDAAADRIWRPQQAIDHPMPGFPYPRCLCEGVGLAEQCNESYRLLDELYGSDLPLEDEGPMLRPFREALHRVARRLNALDWSGILATTDDFVVVATDYIGYWLDEDRRASVPPERLELLRSRGLL